MKLLILLFIPLVVFAQQKPREVPYAAWVETPLPHWRCDAGLVPREVAVTLKAKPLPDFLFANAVPQCLAQDRRMMYMQTYDFNAQTEELVYFEMNLTIGNHGSVHHKWNRLFVRLPGCRVTGDERDHLNNVVADQEGITFSGKPGQHLHSSCLGAIKR